MPGASDSIQTALSISRQNAINPSQAAVVSNRSYQFRHDRVNRLNLTGVLIGFSERGECHKLLACIQERAVQRGMKAKHPSPNDGAEIKAARGDEWLSVRG